jgi:SAM-dependent methyltransferase
MLHNFSEYQLMHQVEQQLWWYKILHEKVLKTIAINFKQNKEIKILDAGCGTGGLLRFLSKNGYTNIQGFDFSIDGVNFCKMQNLSVQQIDILDFDKHFEDSDFDVIITNDVLYQFENQDIKKIFFGFQKKLKSNGILISNNNAFDVFYGTHDIAVGGKQRFVIKDFKKLIAHLPLKITKYTYWSITLSPLILSVRLFQRIKIKLGLIDIKNIKSDLSLSNYMINNILYKIVTTEQQIFKKCFFGSSLFIIFAKEK